MREAEGKMNTATESQPRHEEQGLVVDARDFAHILVLSVRTIRRLDCSGKLPRPVKIGGAVRWRRAEVEAWVEAGCPDRQRWEAMRGLKTSVRAG